jgi:hypothetical protein
MSAPETTRFDDYERDYVEQERAIAMVLSIVTAVQDLVLATTDRDEICDAVRAFVFKNRRERLTRNARLRRGA